MRSVFTCFYLVWIGCASSGNRGSAPAAELCIAENRVEHLGYADPKPRIMLLVRGVRVGIPNGEMLMRDARTDAVEVYVDGRNTETIRLAHDFDRFKTDRLCLYHREGLRDRTMTPGWKIDSAANAQRCHCWD